MLNIPGYLLSEPDGKKRQALNLLQSPELLGWNHMALDVTKSVQPHELIELQDCLEILNH